eukprot:COSAG05_NODE_1968_length_3768_cov_11.358408_2_plen_85_part_00
MARIYYFNPFSVCVHGQRATMADHALMSATLSELDMVLGGALPCQRSWIAGKILIDETIRVSYLFVYSIFIFYIFIYLYNIYLE